MRKVHLLLVAVFGFLTTACIGLCVDWTPVELYIEAVDSEGKSIISPDMPDMTLTFKGQVYPVQRMQGEGALPTKAYAAIMHGLIAQPVNTEDGSSYYRLYFGEIDGEEDMDEDILLNWPDGSEDVIHYHCSGHSTLFGPTCNRSWKLNGKRHEGYTFKFTGKSLR